MSIPLDSTYGVWLVALVLETFLFGMGVLQTGIYFAGRPTDLASIKWTVSSPSIYPSETEKNTGSCRLVCLFVSLAALQSPDEWLRRKSSSFPVLRIFVSFNVSGKSNSISSGK
jgi:hypothetical protein